MTKDERAYIFTVYMYKKIRVLKHTFDVYYSLNMICFLNHVAPWNNSI
jgi:hypothetical protein